MGTTGRRGSQNRHGYASYAERVAAVSVAGALHLGVVILIWRQLPPYNVGELPLAASISVALLAPVQRPMPAQGWPQEPDIDVERPRQEHHHRTRRPGSNNALHAPQVAAPRQRVERAPRPTVAPHLDAAGDTAPLSRDFAWRPSDSKERDQPVARGEPAIRLSPQKHHEGSSLARDMSKAAKPRCHDVHAAKGLMALPFLLVDTVREDGCQW